MGQVFGIAIDGNRDIYVTATAIHFRDEFGPAGPGGIYKIDGASYQVTELVTTNNSANANTIGTVAIPNTGPSLGNICYDPDHNLLFVTNFEDGKIYRINPQTGVVLSTYDPFVADAGKAGAAPYGELLWAVAYRNNRLYVSRWNEHAGYPNANVANQVLSIDLTATGEFIGTALGGGRFSGTPAVVYNVPALVGEVYSMPIADMEFSKGGRLLLAERAMVNPGQSDAHRARLLEIQLNGAAWAPTGNVFQIGEHFGVDNCGGGADYGYRTYNDATNQTADCDSVVWVSGDAIHFKVTPPESYIYGLQRMPARGTNGIAQSQLVDLDGNLLSAFAKTTMGDVDVVQNCASNPCDNLSLAVDTLSGCCFDITATNNDRTGYWRSITADVLTADSRISGVKVPGTWSHSTPDLKSSKWTLNNSATMPLGASGPFKLCLKRPTTGTTMVRITWRGTDGGTCIDTLNLTCDPDSTLCFELPTKTLACKSMPPGPYEFTLTYTVKNKATFNATRLRLKAVSPAGAWVRAAGSFVVNPPLAPNATTASRTASIGGVAPGATVCITVSLASGSQEMCIDTVCMVMPQCKDCCDSLHLKLSNRVVRPRPDGDVDFSETITAQKTDVIPTKLRSFTVEVVKAKRTITCLGGRTYAEDIGAVIKSGTFVTNSQLPPPTQFGTRKATWGSLASGAAVSNAPLNLTIGLTRPQPTCPEYVEICLKYTYTDTACHTCDTTVCFSFARAWPDWWNDREEGRGPDRGPVERLPFLTRDGDKDDGGHPLGALRTDRVLSIAMTSDTAGTLTLENPAIAPGVDSISAMRIVSLGLEPDAALDLVQMRDNSNNQPATFSQRVASIALSPAVAPGMQRTFALTYANPNQYKRWPNAVLIRAVSVYFPNDTAEMVAWVQARTPAGLGGDSLLATGVPVTNVRSYALKFRNGNPNADGIARVVIGIDTTGQDRLMAVGPTADSLTAPMVFWSGVPVAPPRFMVPDPPPASQAVSAPVPKDTTVSPVYVTVCGGSDSLVTITFRAYDSLGGEVSSGSFVASNPLPLTPGPSGVERAGETILLASIGCHPNPAADRVTFSIRLPWREERAVFTLTDVAGREVARLLDGAVLEAGDHELALDLPGLPSGVYYYTLRGERFSQTRSMRIVR